MLGPRTSLSAMSALARNIEDGIALKPTHQFNVASNERPIRAYRRSLQAGMPALPGDAPRIQWNALL
jgi:hypothetical protein